MTRFRKNIAKIGAGLLVLPLMACGAGASDDDANTITLGYIPSWTDGLSTAYLLENQLEAMGYNVEHQTLTEAGVLYAGLADGAVDLYPSAWPEVTHASYMEEFSDRIEDLGGYYDGAILTLAVPEYTDIDSIADLAADPARFGGKIIGIEPGAGLTAATQDRVMPAYGLSDDYTLVTSSTAAMLAELKKATDAGDDIVVTLWRPFWANSEFPVKDLADPEGAFGDPESLHFLARDGFAEAFPEAAEFIEAIQLTDDQYGALEDLVVNQYEEGQEPEAIEQWLEENPGVLPEINN